MKEEYVKRLEEQYESLKNDYLIRHGLVEKEVLGEAENGAIYDLERKEYYRYVPIKLSSKEFEELVSLENKCQNLRNYHGFVSLFRGIGILNLLVGILFSVLYATDKVMSIYFVILFTILFFGIARILDRKH